MSQLGIPVIIAVPELDAVMEDFNRIRVYSASSRFGSKSLLTTLTLADGTTAYEYQDTTGLTTTWYDYTFYHATNLTESQHSAQWAATQLVYETRQTIRRKVCRRLGLFRTPLGDYTWPGPSGTTTGNGTSTTVVSTQYADTSWGQEAFTGMYCALMGGTYAGQERMITTNGLDESTGTFTVTRAYGGAPGTSVDFDIYGLAPYVQWNDWLNQALHDVWMPITLTLAGISNQRTYALPHYIERPHFIRGITYQLGDTKDEHELLDGQDYHVVENDGGGLTLYFHSGIPTNAIYLVRAYRHPDPVNPAYAGDTTTIGLPDSSHDLLVLTTACRAALHFAQNNVGGVVEDTSAWEKRYSQLEAERRVMAREVSVRVQANVRQQPFIAIGGQRSSEARSRYY